MSAAVRPRPRGRRDGRAPLSSLGLHATLVLATLAAVVPVVILVLTSFKPKNDIVSTDVTFLPKHWTAANYRHVLGNNHHEFLRWLWNSVAVATLTTLAALFLAATAAYAFSRYRFPGYRPALMLFLVVQMFPGAILLVPIYNIILRADLLNSKASLVITYSTVAVPFCVWMLKGYFDTIPVALEEAARIDGLSPFGTFWRIVLPLSLPGLAVTAFYGFITAWNEVLFATVFMTKGANYTLPIGLRTYVNQFETHYEWLAAGAVLVTIPAVLVFLLAQRYLVSGLTTGGVKG